MDKAVLIFCLMACSFWAGAELSAALKPRRVEYLLVKDPPKPASNLPSWWVEDCAEVSRICRQRKNMTRTKYEPR